MDNKKEIKKLKKEIAELRQQLLQFQLVVIELQQIVLDLMQSDDVEIPANIPIIYLGDIYEDL